MISIWFCLALVNLKGWHLLTAEIHSLDNQHTRKHAIYLLDTCTLVPGTEPRPSLCTRQVWYQRSSIGSLSLGHPGADFLFSLSYDWFPCSEL